MKWQNNRQTSVINPCTIKQFHLKFLMLLVLFFFFFLLLSRRNIFPRFQNVNRKTRTFNFRSLPAVACSFVMTHRYIILEMNEKNNEKYSNWYYLPNVWESVVCVSLFYELHEINHKTVLKFTAYTYIFRTFIVTITYLLASYCHASIKLIAFIDYQSKKETTKNQKPNYMKTY